LQAPSLSSDKFVLFHTRHHTFQVQSSTVGQFPQACAWYQLRSYTPALPSVAPQTPRRRRSTMSSSLQVMPQQHVPESALLCAWTSHPTEPNFLVQEIYRYMLPPYEECRCLNVWRQLWDTDLDLQAFVIVNGRPLLMGFDGDVNNDEACWNVAVEIQVGSSDAAA
jgi:hypothetical protein